MKQRQGLKGVLIVAVLILSSFSVHAVEFKGVIGFGADFGGDVLKSGIYTDGSTWEVRANQGLVLNGGVVMVTGDFETQTTVGYKFGGPSANNGSVTFSVVPVELIEFYRAGSTRLGLGLSYHSSPKLAVDIPGASYTNEYNDAIGTVAQIGWAPAGTSFSFDLRFTSVSFKQKNLAGAKDISGNTAGLYGSFYF